MLRNGLIGNWINSLACLGVILTLAPASSMAEVIQEAGSLQRGDETLGVDQYADYYEIQTEGGERIQVILTSEDFDTYLILSTPSAEDIENDDAGSTQMSMIRAPMLEAGTYIVTVTSFGTGVIGDYQLLIKTEESNVQVEQDRLGNKGTRVYDIEGEIGQRVSVTLTSDDFDTVVRLNGPDGVIAENDDSGDGTNSQLEAVLPESGTFQIEVDSFGGGEDGRFELTIDIGAPFDISQQGELSRDDDTLPSGEFCDIYEIDATAGDLLEVHAYSSDFDTYLILESPSGEQWDNDDFGGGTDSGMIRILNEAGIYTVTVTTFTSGETGAYSLTIDQDGAEGGQLPKP